MSDTANHSPRELSGRWPLGLLAVLSCVVLALSGCSPQQEKDQTEDIEKQAPRVVTETATSGRVTEKINTTGTIKPQREVVISSEGAGRVIVLAAALGTKVEAGALLARLDATVQDAQREQARAALRQARAALELAQSEFERSKTLHEQQALPDSLLEQARIGRDSSDASVAAAEAGLKLAEKAVSNCSLRAPFAGTVAEVHLELGALVAPGTPAFQLMSVGRLQVLAAVSSSVVGRIEEGMAVLLRVPSIGDRLFHGQVEHLGPSADPRTHTYPLEVLVDNADGALRPGMMAKVEIILEQRSEAVLVPRACIFEGARPSVFVVADGRAVARPVELGQSHGDQVEVLSGVAAGELIVSLGRQNLKDGDPVIPYEMPASTNGEPSNPPATAARTDAGGGGDAETD